MDSEFLTAEEVAEYLRLPLSTVYKLVQDKKLPGFKVGKHGDLELKVSRNGSKNKRKRLQKYQSESEDINMHKHVYCLQTSIGFTNAVRRFH